MRSAASLLATIPLHICGLDRFRFACSSGLRPSALATFFGLFFGLFAGWIACWFGQAKWRKAAKDARRDLAYAQAETSELRRELVVPPDSML